MLVASVELFEAETSVALAVAALRVMSWILVVLEIGLFVRIRRELLGQQTQLGCLEVEVVEDHLAGFDLS